MYHRRLKKSPGRKILNLQGRFSLVHTGGGSFVYSFPGKNHPIVRRVDFTGLKYRLSFSALFLTMVALSGIGMWTTVGTASSRRDFEAEVAPTADKKSEQFSQDIKEKIIKNVTVKPDSSIEYTVRPGDTLSEIGAMYRVLPASILSSSGLKRADDLKPGQKLTIPNRPGLMYRMKPGDTLAAVAQYYTVALEEIQNDNPDLRDMDMIRPGTKVFLPNAKIPPPPPVWFRPAWGYLTSGFGWRKDPITGVPELHTGFDIAISYSPVRAARNGVVIYAGGMG